MVRSGEEHEDVEGRQGVPEARRFDRHGRVIPYLCDSRHVAYQASMPAAAAADSPGVVSRWRLKDRMKTGYVALALCLNIGVDPPDVIKISPCARMECWTVRRAPHSAKSLISLYHVGSLFTVGGIHSEVSVADPFSTSSAKALDAIGKNLQAQYERWQPRADYRICLDPTVDEVKKLCLQCRKNARNERVLFHYNGHGVPRPTINGEIWLFNKHFTQYIPLSVYELESCLGNPSIYLFDCSAAGMIVNSFCERPDWAFGGTSSDSSIPAMRDCILLASCGATETLPQNPELPADVFTSCLTTPIKIALRWFCSRSLLFLDPDLIDKIPGRQNDRKTPLGELNWIFTAVTDTIAWNVLPRELFQRLFRQDLLVASLFRNFLLAERIMRAANCCPQSYPRLPSTHQHSMWHAWDMAAEICLAQLPILLSDPNAEFEPSPFFTEQLTAFEVWLDHGSERKKPPEQLPIVLQVLLSQSHRFRALVLLGRFLDMGAWAVDLALSVGIFPYVLKLLQTTAAELRQILVFIWTKILAQDKSCQVDLVKDGGHWYFIRYLESPSILPEQRAMAAFVLAVIVDGHPRGQQACIQANLIGLCLSHLQQASNVTQEHSEPLLLQWLCLCLGKLWEGSPVGIAKALHDNAPAILGKVLSEIQPEVRAAAIFALGRLVKVGLELLPNERGLDDLDEATQFAEQEISRCLLNVLGDGSPLVRAELATALARLVSSHNRMFLQAAATYSKPPSNSTNFPAFGATPLLESEVLGEDSVGYTNTGSRSRKHSEDENIYVQCVIAVYALSRDPSPPVASLGRQVLRIMGVESAQIVMHARPGENGAVSHQQNSSAPASPVSDVLQRSTSCVTSTAGNLANTWRVSTPPPSPPSRQPFLAGPPSSLRRVTSMDVTATLDAPWDTSRPPVRIAEEVAELASSQIPSNGNANVAAVGKLASRLSAVNLGSGAASSPLPESTFYRWSCGHFSRPLLEPVHDDDEENLAHRERREREALNGIAMCRHSSEWLLGKLVKNLQSVYLRPSILGAGVSKVSDQIASWDTGSEIGTKAVLLHPFKPFICIADDKETIRIWDYEEAADVNTFDNHNALDKGVSKLCLLNETDDSLLLVASNDGSVRVWRDYNQKDNQCLATAWQAVQGHNPGSRSTGAVVDWQQMSGFLYTSGHISWIMVWDLEREQLGSTISTHSDSCVSAMAACQTHGAHVVTGHGDGSVRVYDIRSQDTLVCTMKPHAKKVVGLDFQPGMEFSKVISASPAGDLKFLDMRKSSAPYLEVLAHRGHLTSLTAHRHAPVIATGSGKQLIKTFNTNGKQLNMVKYHNSFLGQRIGPVNALCFHPYKALLAAGAMDSIVSIYSGDIIQDI